MRYLFLFLCITFLFGCGNKNIVVKEEISLPSHFIPNELIVQLKEGVRPEFLEKKFEDQSFKLKEEISALMRAYLFTFDDAVVEPQKMLEMVKSADGVSSAEFNKVLNFRD